MSSERISILAPELVKKEEREATAHKHFFSLGSVLEVALVSDQPLQLDQKSVILGNAYIPDFAWSLESGKSDKSLQIEHHESSTFSFQLIKDKLRIEDTWEGRLPLDLYHLLYGLVRQAYIQQDQYPTHAACIGKDKHILLVGPSGTGKTSTLLRMVSQENMQVFATNKTVLSFESPDHVVAVAGTKTVTAKATDWKRHWEKDHAYDYLDRGAAWLEPHCYTQSSSVEISAVFFPRLNDGAQEYKQLSPLSALHRLYPFCLDSLNADVVLGGGATVLPGDVSYSAKHYLSQQLRQHLDTLPVYEVSGSMDFITKELAQSLESRI